MMQLYIIIINIFIIAGCLCYRRTVCRHRRQYLKMEQRLLCAQMNPHFTSNLLYSIHNTVKKTPDASSQYLLQFSRLLRMTLNNSTKNNIQLEDELNTLRNYLDLQRLRHDSKFSYEFVLNNLEADDFIFVPPMLIQPILENSIEHGFIDVSYQGKIKIMLTKKKKYIECIVEDNGKGLTKQAMILRQSTSTKLINTFLKKATKSEMKIVNKVDFDINHSGLLVTFLIPFKQTADD